MANKVLLAFFGLILSTFTHTASACDTVFFDECLNGVGPAVTNTDGLKSSTVRITSSIHNRGEEIDKRSSEQSGTGLSSGDTLSGWSVWGGYNRSDFGADLPLVNALDGIGNPVPFAVYDADIYGFNIGADRLLGNQFLIGVAVGYEDSDILTEYNGGNNESDGFTLTPYGAYLINNHFSIDLAAGYSKLDYKTDRVDNTNGNIIRGSFDSDRWFIASNLNATFNYENWFFGGRLGYMYSEEKQDAYTETGGPTARSIRERTVDLSQFIASVDASYSLGNFEPYAIASYLNDISRDDGEDAGGLPAGVAPTVDDDDEIQYGVGMRYFNDSVSGTFEWIKTVGRSHFKGHALMLTVRTAL